jgi:hypothetical protein
LQNVTIMLFVLYDILQNVNILGWKHFAMLPLCHPTTEYMTFCKILLRYHRVILLHDILQNGNIW